ncbi:MAG: FAD-dependent oxidoreductase [Salinisphaera sp.]|uniref:flavin monoamine oxidase family protein n=1 Tax=Salinisphaera sp. TaxID=1914330 RepID=UPI003C7D7E74
MQTVRIAIVGGGLAGLYAALLLQERGIQDYVLLEARDVLGGRIASSADPAHLTIDCADDSIDGFDLGAAWFWPGFQQQLDRVVRELAIDRFEQFETGDIIVERFPGEQPIRMRGYVNSPPSMRLAGGMSALTGAVRRRLDTRRIMTGQAVRRLCATGACVELNSQGADGRVTSWCAEHVFLAMPPRLAEERIEFLPGLPERLARQWRGTATWMASHAKYVAIYDRPFWRDQGLSGAARSAIGPLSEIHDASIPSGSAALFGFFGMPATVRRNSSADELRAHCRAQFARLFGPQAATPRAEFIKDWAQEPYTATAADQQPTRHHPSASSATADTHPWNTRLTGIASEWSPQFPGYIAGAIEAASLGVAAWIASSAPRARNS